MRLTMRTAMLVVASLALCAGASAQPELPDDAWRVVATNKEQAIALSKRATGLLHTADAPMAMARAFATDTSIDSGLLSGWWRDYKKTFNKHYSSVADELRAFKNVQRALTTAAALTQDVNKPFWASVNRFADKDWDALKNTVLMKRGPAGAHANATATKRPLARASKPLASAPKAPKAGTTFDWRALGKTTPVKDQGDCGSCWAQAAAATAESALLISKKMTYSGYKINLSEQQFLSCMDPDLGYESAGCDGGYSEEAMEYMTRNDIATEKYIPYKGLKGAACSKYRNPLKSARTAKAVTRARTGYTYIPGNEKALMAAVLKQPVVVYWTSMLDFMYYAGGIYTGPKDCTDYSINHVLVLEGFHWTGKLKGSYWIARNSWGPSWGEQGRVRVAMKGGELGTCNMNVEGGYVPTLAYVKSPKL